MAVSHTVRSLPARGRVVLAVGVASVLLAACGGTEAVSTRAAVATDPPTSTSTMSEHTDMGATPEHAAMAATPEHADMAAASGHDDTTAHAHDTVEAQADMTVAVDAVLDAKMGVNVHVTASGFRWAPEHASGEAVDGEGHAHLYLDGEKVGRLYGEWFHIGTDLAPGDHEVRVTLNANDHRDYAVDGTVVEATATVTVPA